MTTSQTAEAEIIVLADKTLGRIEGPLWGQFIEMCGRGVNGGIYDPGSPRSRADGVREDVLEALKELRPTHLRYPGGCASAYFDWQELVGPKESRPRAKLYRNFNLPQSTEFGIPEAWSYANELGAELYFAVNAHTQSPEDAANLVEYLNADTPTKWADLRRSHGREKPYGIRLFGLGNEIYGDWQAGQKTAKEYTAWCREAIRQMKAVDPNIETICVGNGRPNPDWDREVLNGLIDCIDMISVHNYCGRPLFRDNMAASRIYEQIFNAANVAVDEALDANLSRRERPKLAFDEWNVWYRYRQIRRPEPDVEETFNFGDALTIATIFHVLLRNTKTVALSNIAQAVNVLGVLTTSPDDMIKQSIFFPHKLFRDCHSGRAVETVVDAPVFSAKHERFFNGVIDPETAKDETQPSLLHFDDISALDVLTTIDDDQKRMAISVVNKLEDRALSTRLSLRGVIPHSNQVKVHRLSGSSVEAANTFEKPDEVGLSVEIRDVGEVFEFPPASLTLLEFEL